jgi:hypothetical protein
MGYRRLRENVRKYGLWILLEEEDEPVFAGVRYTLKGLLELLKRYEEQPDFEGAYLEILD